MLAKIIGQDLGKVYEDALGEVEEELKILNMHVA